MQAGTRLGHYEILEPLGAGGMGEVYLGLDSRLGRKVAIKVLPAEFASDPERLARFELEARAAAALNHPHIAVVHDVGSKTGQDGASIHFMVQEYLQGETLREPLNKGALPLKRALGLATEIAEALAAAHAAGIIHRDLKPENIFVTKEGHAKVLDFGLAKLTELAPAGSPGDATRSPTMMGTVAGQVMGTAGYMAPEQVEGGEIDHRADLFSFGCVLYELVTGRQPFAGRSMMQTLDRIVHEQHVPVAEIDPGMPQQLEWILRKALAKELGRRYQGADDLVVDLRELATEVEAGTAMPVSGEAPPPVAVQIVRGIPWKLAAPIAMAIALAAAVGVWITIPSPPESVITRFHIDYPPETTFLNTATLGVAISPDGRSVVFNANRQLWLRPIDGLVATPIRGTDPARVPFFSPDGQRLGFWGGDGQMKSVSVTGGAPVSLGPAPVRAHGASWADDGYIYFGQGAGGILRVSENGGEPEVVVQMEKGEQANGPRLLPGGKWLLFTLRSSGSWNDASIVAQALSGGERKVLVAGGTDGRYVPTGHIVYSLEGNLFAVPFDAESIEVTGGSVSIVEEVQQATAFTGASQYAFSDRGGLVYISGGTESDSQLAWVDRNGQVELLPFEARSSMNLDLSPDEQRIALEILGDDGRWNIWIYEVARGGSQVLLTTEGSNRSPVWSPDGEWVFFASDRGGNNDIWKRRADRSLDAELVLDTEATVSPTSISAQMLLFQSGDFGTLDVGVLALNTGREPEMLVATAADEFGGSFSPDGLFFAFSSNETGQFEVNVREISSGRTFPVSTSARGGFLPVWSQDGREIYYNAMNSWGILVAEVVMEPFSASDPVELSDIVRRPFANFDATADQQRFLVPVPAGSADSGAAAPGTRLNVVLNWFEELKQRVPTGS